MRYQTGDFFRCRNYSTTHGWRVWRVVGVYLGAIGQEGTYECIPIDVNENKPIQIPCILLENNPNVQKL